MGNLWKSVTRLAQQEDEVDMLREGGKLVEGIIINP